MQAVQTVRFKRYSADGKTLNHQKAWVEFPDSPPGFEDWCNSQALIEGTHKPALGEYAGRLTAYTSMNADSAVLVREILVFIAAAGEFLGCEFTVDDEGLHKPTEIRTARMPRFFGFYPAALWDGLFMIDDQGTVIGPTATPKTRPRLERSARRRIRRRPGGPSDPHAS